MTPARAHRPWPAAPARSRNRARAGAEGAEGGAGARCPARSPRRGCADHARRARPAQPGGAGRRLRQERRGAGPLCARRLRLHRGRRRHPAPAARQPAPAPVPPDRGPRRDQPLRLQQRRHGGDRRPPCPAAEGRGDRPQPRRQQGQRRPRRRFRPGAGRLRRASGFRHRQRLVAQHREAARSAGQGGARRAAWPGAGGARRAGATGPGLPQDRPGSDRRGAGGHRRGRPRGRHRRDHRHQHDARPRRAAQSPCRAKWAVFRARRCSRNRPGCWPASAS